MMPSPDPQFNAPRYLTLWSAKVGPLWGPYEVYPYYSLPFCRFAPARGDVPAAATRDPSDLGQLLAGYHWERFADLPSPPAPNETLGALTMEASHESPGRDEGDDQLGVTHHLSCATRPLSHVQARRLAQAVERQWFYQLYLLDLPAWGMIGEMLPSADGLVPHVYQNRKLAIHLDDKNDIIQVDLSSDSSSLAKIETNETYDFALEFQYLRADSDMIARGRYRRYEDHEFFNSEPRKFSAINNAMVGTFLFVLTGVSLKKIWKFNNGDNTLGGCKASNDTEKGITENLLPSAQEDAPLRRTLDPKDVFALPARLVLLAALVGNGWHLVVWTAVTTLCLQGRSPLEYGPGGNSTLIIWAYAATSIVAGYVSSYHYQHQRARAMPEHGAGNPDAWKLVMLANLLIPPAIVVTAWSITASASIVFGMIHGISSAGATRLSLLWTLVVVPLQIAGAGLGRLHQATCGNALEGFPSLCIPPPKSRLDKRCMGSLRMRKKAFGWGTIVIGGLLPFSTILAQSYFVMVALWNYKFFLVGQLDVLHLVLAVLVTSASGVILSLIYMNSNEFAPTWQWNTLLGAMSTGVYSFCYAVYYYMTKLQLEGLVSKINYFGVMMVISSGVSIACGAIAHSSAYTFLHLLYSNIKAA